MTPDDDTVINVKSRSQKKRDSTALQTLGESLTKLSPATLKALPIPHDLHKAIADWHALKGHEAKRRQMQYIGRLMREELEDPTGLQSALETLEQKNQQAKQAFHQVEATRNALLDESQEARELALATLLGRLPKVNEKKLRHLMTGALAEREKKRPSKMGRELFRMLQEAFTGQQGGQ